VKSGFLPNLSGGLKTIEATLTLNDSARFEDRWVYLKRLRSRCVWTEGVADIVYLPVAHGEGKFVAKDHGVLKNLRKNHQVVFEYADENGKRRGYPYNPNGSVENIAGICDKSGRIFGLMPHPERHINNQQHPRWTRRPLRKRGDGFRVFENGVLFAKKYL
jgi:phosphoribosylformylglycinamidine synthase